jgi:hypothetical protein
MKNITRNEMFKKKVFLKHLIEYINDELISLGYKVLSDYNTLLLAQIPA